MDSYKGFKLNRNEFGSFTIHMIGKGALPIILRGSFNSLREVMTKIDAYLEIKNNG